MLKPSRPVKAQSTSFFKPVKAETMEHESKDDAKRRVTARCHGLENMGWIDDRKMRCSFCAVMRQCMWGPLTRMRIHNEEVGCASLDERDPYGPICMQCSECWRPSGYDYIAQMLRSKVDGVLLARHSHIIDCVAEYCWMSCALYARWVEIYDSGSRVSG